MARKISIPIRWTSVMNQTVDACDDPLGGAAAWHAVTGTAASAVFSISTTQYMKGGYSYTSVKNNTNVVAAWEKNFSPTTWNAVGGSFSFAFWVKNAATLAKFKTGLGAIVIWIGASSTDYYSKQWRGDGLVVGWNVLTGKIQGPDADFSGGGASDPSALFYVRLTIETTSANQILGTDDFAIDDLKIFLPGSTLNMAPGGASYTSDPIDCSRLKYPVFHAKTLGAAGHAGVSTIANITGETSGTEATLKWLTSADITVGQTEKNTWLSNDVAPEAPPGQIGQISRVAPRILYVNVVNGDVAFAEITAEMHGISDE